MPWTKDDADEHKSGLSDEQKKQWAKIANSVLEKDGDEAKAIRIANSQVGKSAEYLAIQKGVEEVRKHLIGRHDQKNHDPNKKSKGHSRQEHSAGQRVAGAALGALGAAGLASLLGSIGSKDSAGPMWEQTGASGPFIPTSAKLGALGLLGYGAQRKKGAEERAGQKRSEERQKRRRESDVPYEAIEALELEDEEAAERLWAHYLLGEEAPEPPRGSIGRENKKATEKLEREGLSFGKSDHMSTVAKMWREDPTFRAMAMTYLGADEEVEKHLIGRHDQKKHARGSHKGTGIGQDPTKAGGSRGEYAQTKTKDLRKKGKEQRRQMAQDPRWDKIWDREGTPQPGAEQVYQDIVSDYGAAEELQRRGLRAGRLGSLAAGGIGAGLIGLGVHGDIKAQSQRKQSLGRKLRNQRLDRGIAEAASEGRGFAQEMLKRPDLPDELKDTMRSMWGINKSVDDDFDSNFTAVGEFSKVDEDKQQVFGWASIVEKDGTPVVDLQGDFISPGDLEQAAYDYVLDSRVGGEMHQRVGKSAPKEVGTLIESMVITPEKVSKLGLPEGSLPTGWWVGYQVKDPDVWSKVKKGEYAGFSIHGYGKRKAISKEEVGKSHDTREVLIAKALQFADTPESFAKNLWATAQALEDRDQRDEAMYFGRVAAGVFAASED